jgi:hypothetical protein
MTAKRYLTEAEVAEMTGRAVSTLRNDRYYRRGIPYIKVGRSVRYNLEETIGFMESRKVLTTNDHKER